MSVVSMTQDQSNSVVDELTSIVRSMADTYLKGRAQVAETKLTKFDGSNCDPKEWMQKFEKVAFENSWTSDLAKILIIKSQLVEGSEASKWYDSRMAKDKSLPDSERNVWIVWRKDFVEKFENIVNANTLNQFLKCKTDGNDIEQYITTKLRLMHRAFTFSMPNEDTINFLISGLPHHLFKQFASKSYESVEQLKQDLLTVPKKEPSSKQKAPSETASSVYSEPVSRTKQFIPQVLERQLASPNRRRERIRLNSVDRGQGCGGEQFHNFPRQQYNNNNNGRSKYDNHVRGHFSRSNDGGNHSQRGYQQNGVYGRNNSRADNFRLNPTNARPSSRANDDDSNSIGYAPYKMSTNAKSFHPRSSSANTSTVNNANDNQTHVKAESHSSENAKAE